MSAILDALRKSDRERRIGQTPTLDDAPMSSGDSKRRGWFLPVAILIAVILAGVLLWQDGRWRAIAKRAGLMGSTSEQPAPPATPADAAEIAGSVTESVAKSDSSSRQQPSPPPEPTPQTGSSNTRPVASAQRPAASARPDPIGAGADRNFGAAKPPAATTDPIMEPPPAVPDSAAQRQSPTQPEPASTDPKPLHRRIYELPLDVRRQLPSLTLNAHMYSREPEERMVLLNMKRLYEGDDLEGVTIAEILPYGALLSYQGYEFLVER